VTTPAIEAVFAPPPPYEDGGAGAYNAAVLDAAGVRPAFFDSSCLLYRWLYAKAADYCKFAGSEDDRLVYRACADVICDMAEACRVFRCAPVVAFDSRISYRREAVFAGYKSGRGTAKKTEAEERVLGLRHRMLAVLRDELLPSYRVQTYCVRGYESDDVIASFVLGLKHPKRYDGQVVIVSNDHDLHQLVTDGVRFADVMGGVLFDAAGLRKRYGFGPEQVVPAKVFGGCSSDDVPNVPGCGEVSVRQLLESRDPASVKQSAARESLVSTEGGAVVRRNMALVRLPFDGAAFGCPPLPPLRLSRNMWPGESVPEEIAALFGSFGIPQSAWPSFRDIRRALPAEVEQMF